MFYRYVTDKVHERLIKLFSVSSSTGKSICDQVCENLKLANINIKNCNWKCYRRRGEYARSVQ